MKSSFAKLTNGLLNVHSRNYSKILYLQSGLTLVLTFLPVIHQLQDWDVPKPAREFLSILYSTSVSFPAFSNRIYYQILLCKSNESNFQTWVGGSASYRSRASMDNDRV